MSSRNSTKPPGGAAREWVVVADRLRSSCGLVHKRFTSRKTVQFCALATYLAEISVTRISSSTAATRRRRFTTTCSLIWSAHEDLALVTALAVSSVGSFGATKNENAPARRHGRRGAPRERSYD